MDLKDLEYTSKVNLIPVMAICIPCASILLFSQNELIYLHAIQDFDER